MINITTKTSFLLISFASFFWVHVCDLYLALFQRDCPSLLSLIDAVIRKYLHL